MNWKGAVREAAPSLCSALSKRVRSLLDDQDVELGGVWDC